MTQTMIQTLEMGFEPIAKKNALPATLAEAVSNELMKMMPRLSPELFERTRDANVKLSQQQTNKIDEHYHREHHGGNYAGGVPKQNILRLCNARIPVFAYACVPDQKEVVYAEAGKVLYEGMFNFSTTDGHAKIEQDGNAWYWHWERGSSTIEVKSIWHAPFTLGVCVKVPEVPSAVAELGDEALLAYFSTVRQLRRKVKEGNEIRKPALGVLWLPTDESLYCSGEVPQLPKNDPALILDIPDGHKRYRHVVATWNIGEERPFKHWLSEYSQ